MSVCTGKDNDAMHDEEFRWEYLQQEQQDKLRRYRILNQYVRKGETLFVGSSLMEQFPIHELLMDNGISMTIYNRGIGGFTTTDMLQYMEEMVYALEPSRIFINIGTNDISRPGYCLTDMIANYRRIILEIRQRLPKAQIYMMAYYPVNETDLVIDEQQRSRMFQSRNNANIHLANAAAAEMAEETGCRFIDVNEGLTDANGRLRKEYSVEGIHMYANGYQVVFRNLRPYLV